MSQGQQLRVSSKFNGPYLFNLLEEVVNSDNPRDINIDSIFLNLIKNLKLLLNFNYKINQNYSSRSQIDKNYLDKDDTYDEVNSITYILQTLLYIIEHKNCDRITKHEKFSEFINVLPKLLTLSTITEKIVATLNSNNRLACTIFFQLLQMIKDSEYLTTYLNNKISLASTTSSDDFGDNDEILLHVIIRLAAVAANYAKFHLNELDNFKEIFELFLPFIDLHFNENQDLLTLPDIYFYTHPQHHIILNYLNLVCVLVDKPILVSTFIYSGYVKAVLQWMLFDLKYEYHLVIILIIHNFGRDPHGKFHVNLIMKYILT